MGIVITHFTEEGMWLKLIHVYNVLGFPDEVCSSVAEYNSVAELFLGFGFCVCMWHAKVGSSRSGSKMQS